MSLILPLIPKEEKYSQLLDFQFAVDKNLKVYLIKIKNRIKLKTHDSKYKNMWKKKLMGQVF